MTGIREAIIGGSIYTLAIVEMTVITCFFAVVAVSLVALPIFLVYSAITWFYRLADFLF